MPDNIQERKERERQEDLAKLRGLRPIDDDFMRCLFRDNIPLAEFVLRILLGKPDLKIVSIELKRRRISNAWSEPGLSAWTPTPQTTRAENTILKYSDPNTAQALTGRAIIPARWTSKTWTPASALTSCPIRTRSLLQKTTSSEADWPPIR